MKKHDLKTLWILFVIFFKAGTFTFAGGLAMLPLIQRDVVDKYQLLPKDDFLEYATLAQTLPGIIALNCASFVGRRVAGRTGMFVAGLGSTISAFALMIVATVLLQSIPQQGPIAGAFKGIRAASSAFILAAAFTLGRHNLKNSISILLMLASFALVFFANISAPVVIILAGLVGYAYQRFKLKQVGKSSL
jgi:chromate transporter